MLRVYSLSATDVCCRNIILAKEKPIFLQQTVPPPSHFSFSMNDIVKRTFIWNIKNFIVRMVYAFVSPMLIKILSGSIGS